MTWRRIGLALAALALAAAPAAAQDRLDAAAAALDRATTQPKTEATAVGARLGWGDFFIAHRIAMRGAHPVDKVFAARRSGAGRTEIAEEANVSSDVLVQDVATVWPDAARAAAPSSATPAPRRQGARPVRRPARAVEPPANPAPEDIRDRMIRGGARSR